MTALSFHRITQSDQDMLTQAKTLYEVAFGELIQIEWPYIVESLDQSDPDGESHFYVLERTGSLIGFIYLEINLERRLAFLSYIAVAETERNHGYGSKMIQSVEQLIAEQFAGRVDALCIEFENPPANPATEEDQWKLRRKKFYQRLGYTCLENFWLDLGDDGLTEMIISVKLLNPSLTLDRAFWKWVVMTSEHGRDDVMQESDWQSVCERIDTHFTQHSETV